MWLEINDNNDVIKFMNEMCFFHDSCIKEIRYLSGAYVDDELSMYPVNDCRKLNVIVQRQFENFSMIEMEFEGLKKLNLYPVNNEYTCEILDSTMIYKNGFIYWCDCGGLTEADIEQYNGTIICASKLRWRSIKNRMGKEEVFQNTACDTPPSNEN